ncbi:MAG: hypothetical protein AAF434_00865 [Pseudomonadota bacterium]
MTTETSETKPGYLEDNQGNPSSMRLMSMVALFASIVFGFIAITHEGSASTTNGVYITVAFLLAAFAPKALQKFAEAKMPVK